MQAGGCAREASVCWQRVLEVVVAEAEREAELLAHVRVGQLLVQPARVDAEEVVFRRGLHCEERKAL